MFFPHIMFEKGLVKKPVGKSSCKETCLKQVLFFYSGKLQNHLHSWGREKKIGALFCLLLKSNPLNLNVNCLPKFQKGKKEESLKIRNWRFNQIKIPQRSLSHEMKWSIGLSGISWKFRQNEEDCRLKKVNCQRRCELEELFELDVGECLTLIF